MAGEKKERGKGGEKERKRKTLPLSCSVHWVKQPNKQRGGDHKSRDGTLSALGTP